MTFADILASMDAVISKPGFGILSDCIANRKPLIYADRSDFREYPILVDAIRKYIKHVHIPAAELYRGNLEESLACIWESPEPEGELAWAVTASPLAGLPSVSNNLRVCQGHRGPRYECREKCQARGLAAFLMRRNPQRAGSRSFRFRMI